MEKIMNGLKSKGEMSVSIGETDYRISPYIDGNQGNIIRKDGTVLTRFYVDAGYIRFAFQKREKTRRVNIRS